MQHVKNLSTLASKAMHLLRKRIVNLYLTVDSQLKHFDQTIVPILLHGSEITGFENLQPLETIHLHFMRHILKMKSSTPLVMVYGDFGRYPLEIQIKVRMIKFCQNFWLVRTAKYHLKCIYSYNICIETMFIHVNGFCI